MRHHLRVTAANWVSVCGGVKGSGRGRLCSSHAPSPVPVPHSTPGCSMSRRLRRSRRVVLEKPWQSLEERGSAQPDPHPALARWVPRP